MASNSPVKNLDEIENNGNEPNVSKILDDQCNSGDIKMSDNEDCKESSPKDVNKVGDGDSAVKRQIQKGDSGISVKTSDSSEEDSSKRQKIKKESDKTSSKFSKLNSKTRKRNYRLKKSESGDGESSDDESGSGGAAVKEEMRRSSPDSGHQENAALDDAEMENTLKDLDINIKKSSKMSESDDSDDSSDEEVKKDKVNGSKAEYEKVPGVLKKEKPKHKWFLLQEVIDRQKGVSGHIQGSELFQQRCYGSLHVVERLELMYKLESHSGCVNALHFNSTGDLLASGSDDLKIVVWDWPIGKYLVSFHSGHKSNVFQVKFLPLTGHIHIASCGRDGVVRLNELSSTGACRASRRLAMHRAPSNKLALLEESPHVFLSSGEDGLVLSLDVRLPKPNKLLCVTEGERKVALYSIHSNPLNNNEFCVGGRNPFVRIYDRRKISSNLEPLKKLSPFHRAGGLSHVTCAMYNYNGTEILASYNDEDIYLFDTRETDGSKYVYRYQGHRNNATVKGVSFFGPKSEYIVSGSDCGNIFFWDKCTEAIVQYMPGDENGVVNCLEPHPQLPILASSGLDDDVKIWVPSCESSPEMEGLQSTVVSNIKSREDDKLRDPEAFDGQMLWILWRHIRRAERRTISTSNTSSPFGFGSDPPSGGERQDNPAESSSSDSSGSSDTEGDDSRMQCSPS